MGVGQDIVFGLLYPEEMREDSAQTRSKLETAGGIIYFWAWAFRIEKAKLLLRTQFEILFHSIASRQTHLKWKHVYFLLDSDAGVSWRKNKNGRWLITGSTLLSLHLAL